MKKVGRRLILLALAAGCFLAVQHMDIQPTEEPVSGAALVESVLEERTERTAESLAIVQAGEGERGGASEAV